MRRANVLKLYVGSVRALAIGLSRLIEEERFSESSVGADSVRVSAILEDLSPLLFVYGDGSSDFESDELIDFSLVYSADYLNLIFRGADYVLLNGAFDGDVISDMAALKQSVIEIAKNSDTKLFPTAFI